MAIDPAGLDLVNPKVLHPRLALPRLIGCQTSLKSLIYGANFRKSVRGTDSFISSERYPANDTTLSQTRTVKRRHSCNLNT